MRYVREGFGKGLEEAGSNEKVVVLTADLTDSTKVNFFKEKYPDRFIETGIQEQNMAGVAAGVASQGFIPVIASYAVFNPGRNWEQIRTSICYNNFHVIIVGSHAGLNVGPDGATHQALEDVAIASVLPSMTVLAPCDFNEAQNAIKKAIEYFGPIYFRMPRSKVEDITNEQDNFEIGKSKNLSKGKDITIISYGPMVAKVMRAVKALPKISADVINMHTIKPFDKEAVLSSVLKTNKCLIVEEHQKIGGLGSMVATFLSEKFPCKCKILAVDDKFGESGSAEELYNKYDINTEDIVFAIRELVQLN